MAYFLRKATPQPAARDPDPFACRCKRVSDACEGVGRESGAFGWRVLPLVPYAAPPSVFNMPRAKIMSYLRQIAGNMPAKGGSDKTRRLPSVASRGHSSPGLCLKFNAPLTRTRDEPAAKDFRLNGGDKLLGYSRLSAGYRCSFEDGSDFPGSVASDWLCTLLARDRSLGSERNSYESGR
jgi:hypothetical protein